MSALSHALPAPATLELLRGVAVYGVEPEGETITPTGAAILTTLAAGYGALPVFHLQQIGYGAGRRDPDYPNVLRVLVGEARDGLAVDWLALIETNIDDLNPQLYEHAMEQLFQAGALDVWLTPMHMKKNRPAILLSVLARPENEAAVTRVLFRETTTLGVRRQLVERLSLARQTREIETR